MPASKLSAAASTTSKYCTNLNVDESMSHISTDSLSQTMLCFTCSSPCSVSFELLLPKELQDLSHLFLGRGHVRVRIGLFK